MAEYNSSPVSKVIFLFENESQEVNLNYENIYRWKEMKQILVAAREETLSSQIIGDLQSEFILDSVSKREEIVKVFSQKRYDFLLLDIYFIEKFPSSKNYHDFLKPFWHVFPDVDIIVLTQPQNIRKAVDVVKAGASDYLTLPILPDDLKFVLNRIIENNKILSELSYLRDHVIEKDFPLSLHTKSPLMKEVFSNVRSVAETDSTVLITGETGTGKGLIAKLIHQESKRKDFQFISIHCGAIPDALLESELFGHEKGSFTGAIRRKLGKFEIADKGTVFLDEIGTISPAMQIKLLQVIQDKVFYRVGGEESIKADVRIIAATNSDLASLAEEDIFRRDLFYRLNVFQIEIPPLRDRLEDLPILVEQILKKLNRFLGKNITDINEEVMQAFFDYEWPGNIRELENLMERAYILETSSILRPKSFPLKLFGEKFRKYIHNVDISITLGKNRQLETERVEREYLVQLMTLNKGRLKETALKAGIGVRQLNNLLKKYGLPKELFK